MIKLSRLIVHRFNGALYAEHSERCRAAAVIRVYLLHKLPHIGQRLFRKRHADAQRIGHRQHIFFFNNLVRLSTAASRGLRIAGYQITDVRFYIAAFQFFNRKAAQLFCAAQHSEHARQGIHKAPRGHHGPKHHPDQHLLKAFLFQLIQHSISSFTRILAFRHFDYIRPQPKNEHFA